ncbi:hypothetical protein J6590_037753 [Homalodisca vitripennis]|nr:hypothetical protein J6590_037753 [Homalodisca vitripennis]
MTDLLNMHELTLLVFASHTLTLYRIFTPCCFIVCYKSCVDAVRYRVGRYHNEIEKARHVHREMCGEMSRDGREGAETESGVTEQNGRLPVDVCGFREGQGRCQSLTELIYLCLCHGDGTTPRELFQKTNNPLQFPRIVAPLQPGPAAGTVSAPLLH